MLISYVPKRFNAASRGRGQVNTLIYEYQKQGFDQTANDAAALCGEDEYVKGFRAIVEDYRREQERERSAG